VNSIDDKVRQIVAAQLGVNALELAPTASFVDDLGADRQDLALLRLALENAFQAEIDDTAQIHTVGQTVAYFASRSGPRP